MATQDAEMMQESASADENERQKIETVPLTTDYGVTHLCTPTNCCKLNLKRHEPAPVPAENAPEKLKSQDAIETEAAVAAAHFARLEKERASGAGTAASAGPVVNTEGAGGQGERLEATRLQKEVEVMRKLISDTKRKLNSAGEELSDRRGEVERASEARKGKIAETAMSSAATKMRSLHDDMVELEREFQGAFGMGDGEQGASRDLAENY